MERDQPLCAKARTLQVVGGGTVGSRFLGPGMAQERPQGGILDADGQPARGFARAGQEAEINAASFPLTPGMAVVAEVKRATRRAITFFLLPLPCFVDKVLSEECTRHI